MDIKQIVTDRIIAKLEQLDEVNWEKPWSKIGGLPQNPITGTTYSGINLFSLMLESKIPYYCTFKQAQAIGAKVKKGAKGLPVVYYSNVEKKKNNEAGEEESDRYFLAKGYYVFSFEDLENVPEQYQDMTFTEGHSFEEEGEAILKNIIEGYNIQLETSQRACFIPSRDIVALPPKSKFQSVENYYAVLTHELTHWTGHKDRLNRDEKLGGAKKNYAFEELVAEMGSALFQNRLGLLDATLENHANYLKSWLQALKDDKNFIFKAASEAQKAYNYLMVKSGIDETATV